MDVTAYTVRDAILRVPRTKLKPQHILCPGMYQLQVRKGDSFILNANIFCFRCTHPQARRSRYFSVSKASACCCPPSLSGILAEQKSYYFFIGDFIFFPAAFLPFRGPSSMKSRQRRKVSNFESFHSFKTQQKSF